MQSAMSVASKTSNRRTLQVYNDGAVNVPCYTHDPGTTTRSLFSQSFYTQQLIGAECHLYTSAWPDHCAGYPVCCMAIATCEELSESGAAMARYRHLHDFSKKSFRNSKVQIYHDECRFRATWLTTKAAVSIWTALGPTTL